MKRGRRRAFVLMMTAALGVVTGVGGSPALAAEVGLTPFLNNVGIAQSPASNANFDGVGWSYSAQALLIGDPQNGYEGVQPGDTVTSGGFTFTWPDRPSGASDNVVAMGQTIPIQDAGGATKVGFLGASDHGPVKGTFKLTYTFVDADGVTQQVTRDQAITFSDWTLNAGSAPPSAGNTVVMRNLYRAQMSAVPQVDAPHVFVIGVPLEPGMTLQSVKLPLATGGQIHLFGMAIV